METTLHVGSLVILHSAVHYTYMSEYWGQVHKFIYRQLNQVNSWRPRSMSNSLVILHAAVHYTYMCEYWMQVHKFIYRQLNQGNSWRPRSMSAPS